jgi:hypothetical protein
MAAVPISTSRAGRTIDHARSDCNYVPIRWPIEELPKPTTSLWLGVSSRNACTLHIMMSRFTLMTEGVETFGTQGHSASP